MPLVYRSMLPDGDKPRVGAEAKCLGVKVPGDMTPTEQDTVRPGMGGMSVAPRWQLLPPHLIPKRFREFGAPDARGSDKLVCWRTGSGPFVLGAFAPRLVLRPDSPRHGVVEPDQEMALDAFQLALAATRDEWLREEPSG